MGAVFPVIRAAIITLALAVLAGCANDDDSFDVVRAALLPGQQEFDARFQAAARQNAPQLKLALLQFDAATLLVRESRRDGIDTWISADGATVLTQGGFIVALHGFGAGLLAAGVDQTRTMVTAGREGASERFATFLTGNDETVTRTFRCVIENRGQDNVQIGASTVSARLMAEDCLSLDNTFQNLYWVTPADNRIVQSSQWTGDFIGYVATQVVP